MTIRERLEWLMRMSLLVFILASAAFLSAITAMRFAIHSREVTMPNLIGKSVAEANRELVGRGLVLRVADRIYSDIPLNAVVRQSPPPGMQMKISQQAHVVLSLGKHQLTIPGLEGNSLRASRIELLRGSLQIGEISTPYLADVPAEIIALQSPRPGEGATSPRVDLLVSAGPRETAYVMPYLVGLSDVEAQRRLDAANLRRKLTYQSARQWPRGTVIAQNPAPGARFLSTATAELTVAN
ncbi:MAG TPA: PASTA domain-containing protein [Candidatus Acidoferrales bacterium]|nr:PASTA domain-containing protein [Candidatus Acidoferrales bacterium]